MIICNDVKRDILRIREAIRTNPRKNMKGIERDKAKLNDTTTEVHRTTPEVIL